MKNKRGILCMMLGLILLGSAVGLLVYNTWQEKAGEESVENVMDEMEKIVVPLKHGADILPKQVQSVMVDENEYVGILELPSIDQSFPILKTWSNELLKIAPCCYKGSYLEDNMIIAGHNYSSGFGQIKKLELGDLITFIDTIGNTIKYQVFDIEIIKGTDVEAMEEGEDWDLTLFSCTYGGQERYTVRCVKVSQEE